MSSDLHTRIARRLRAIREARGLSQNQVSTGLGFKDRQILSAIESGVRRVSAEELERAADVFGVEVDYFTDAFRLDGEGEFSFRVSEIDTDVLETFEQRAGRWVAAFRELSVQQGHRLSHIATKLELTRDARFEDVWSAADELRAEWNLGDTPATQLHAAIEHEIGALVLNVDAPQGVSGAASRLPGLNAILINRREPTGRRNFDLAHELFHLLTWDAMRPARVEPLEPKPGKGARVEQLANTFAAALLMPADVLARRWAARRDADVHDWLNATATHLRVTASALRWRMHNLKYLSSADLKLIRQELLVANGGTATDDALPPLFSAEFIRRVHTGVEAGRLSVRRAAKLLGLRLSEFAELCRHFDLPLSYDA